MTSIQHICFTWLPVNITRCSIGHFYTEIRHVLTFNCLLWYLSFKIENVYSIDLRSQRLQSLRSKDNFFKIHLINSKFIVLTQSESKKDLGVNCNQKAICLMIINIIYSTRECKFNLKSTVIDH